jgi:phosphoadenosine phosphosulfate reductase
VNREAEARDLLARIARDCHPAALASSLSAEDMLLADLIARERLPIEVFVLDTGRLHGDTLALIPLLEQRYGLQLRVWRPRPEAVREYELQFGRNAFYRGPELRKQCCHIRKVEPLGRALAGKSAWITGMRSSQSELRARIQVEEWDAAHGLKKFNPLAGWREDEVWSYIRRNDVPYNRLHDQGYRSIGCAPCTRPVVEGEDARAGRWWWEAQDQGGNARECGIHFSPDGKLVRDGAPA